MLLCPTDDGEEEEEDHDREEEVLQAEAVRKLGQPADNDDVETNNQDGALRQGGHHVALAQSAQSQRHDIEQQRACRATHNIQHIVVAIAAEVHPYLTIVSATEIDHHACPHSQHALYEIVAQIVGYGLQLFQKYTNEEHGHTYQHIDISIAHLHALLVNNMILQ